jgi:hypothetical protein
VGPQALADQRLKQGPAHHRQAESAQAPGGAGVTGPRRAQREERLRRQHRHRRRERGAERRGVTGDPCRVPLQPWQVEGVASAHGDQQAADPTRELCGGHGYQPWTTRLMIAATWTAGSSDEDVAELRAVLDSIRVET